MLMGIMDIIVTQAVLCIRIRPDPKLFACYVVSGFGSVIKFRIHLRLVLFLNENYNGI